MNRLIFLAVIQSLAAGLAADAARAQLATSEAYAIVVGSNPGGPGQEALRYAEEDANRVRDLLVELGSYRPDHIQRLLHPSASELVACDRARSDIRGTARARILEYFNLEALELELEQSLSNHLVLCTDGDFTIERVSNTGNGIYSVLYDQDSSDDLNENEPRATRGGEDPDRKELISLLPKLESLANARR
jgi:hypothetical protein